MEAWNAHDMDAPAEIVDENVDFITVGGRWLEGREAFNVHHTGLHTTVRRSDATLELLATHAQRLSSDVLLAHVEWHTEGDRDPDGTARQPRNTIMTWVLMESGERWRIRASHSVTVTIAAPRLTRAVQPIDGPARAPLHSSDVCPVENERERLAGLEWL